MWSLLPKDLPNQNSILSQILGSREKTWSVCLLICISPAHAGSLDVVVGLLENCKLGNSVYLISYWSMKA